MKIHEQNAFPLAVEGVGIEHGLTKREEFAKAAMQGIISDGGSNPEAVAIAAVKYADALLKALEAKERVQCKWCNGTGTNPNSVTCASCRGTGTLEAAHDAE